MVEASHSAGNIFEAIFCKIRVYNTIYLTNIVFIGLILGPYYLLLTFSLAISIQLFDWAKIGDIEMTLHNMISIIYVYTKPSSLL